MKLKRKKIGDRNYNLIDTATGEVIANAVQTGEHGRDNYPWDWSMEGERIFGRLDVSTGGSADSLKYVVDYVESLGEAHGILKPVGEVSPYDIKEGQVFRLINRGIRYFFRATQDAYGEIDAHIPANNHKGELTEVHVAHDETVTLYTETGEAPQDADRDAKREAAIAKAKEDDEAAALSARRDELAREFDHKYAASYDLLGKPAQRAIDRIIELEGGPKPKPQALKRMVAKLDARNKRTSRGYVTSRDELIAILKEVSKNVSVSIIEEERQPFYAQHKEISVNIKLGLTLERDLL